jgi:hypothetical protein
MFTMKPLVLLMSASLVIVGAGSAIADSKETTLAPTAVISPFTYWPNSPNSGRFYRPTGIQVGNSYFMYVQGGAFINVHTGPGSETIGPEACPTIGEKILRFSTPWTGQGLRSTFNYTYGWGVVSPCDTDPSHQPVHFQTGSAFRSSTDGMVKLLIDETENGSNVMKGNFKKVLLGSSADGITFSWSQFVQQSVVGGRTYSIYLVKLVQATASSNWWGSFWWASCSPCDGTQRPADVVTAPGRIKVIMDPTNPRKYVVYLLSGGAWQRVNDDGTFNFVPDSSNDILTQSIVSNNGAWEEWGDNQSCTAQDGCYMPPTPACSTFQYFWTTQEDGTHGPLQTVTSAVRPMPTRNGNGRLGPFRMQDMNAARLLYSSSGDAVCALGEDTGFAGSEIIVTELNN